MERTAIQSKKINKSKRLMVGIPEGLEVYDILMRNGNKSHWKILEAMARQLPKSRAERANKIFSRAIEEILELYPESKDKWALIKSFVYIQILGIEMGDGFEYEETKKRKLDAAFFEELRKL